MQRTIVMLLLVVAGWLGANLFRDIHQSRAENFGQVMGVATNDYVMATATAPGASNAVVFILDTQNQSVGAYTADKNGVELLGSRRVTWDLQFDELQFNANANRETKSVRAVRQKLQGQPRHPPGTGSDNERNSNKHGSPPPVDAKPPGVLVRNF